MGTFTTTIEIGDARGRRFEKMEMLVDDSVMPTIVPSTALLKMGIIPTKRQVFEYANGEQVELGMAEAIVRFQDEEAHTWVVFGDDSRGATLGRYTLGGLFLRVDSEHQCLVPTKGVLATPILVN